MPRRRVGWQPSRFLADRNETERGPESLCRRHFVRLIIQTIRRVAVGRSLLHHSSPGEPPHERTVNHPGTPRSLQSILGEITFDGGRGRVGSHRHRRPAPSTRASRNLSRR
jgi:hypothetical protein